MPGGALQHHVQGVLAEVGLHHARAAAVRIGLPPRLQPREDALAVARDVLARAQRRGFLHDPLVGQLAAVVHRFEKSLDDPENVVAQHVCRIVEGFLESMHDGRELTYERIMQEAPALRSGEDIARYGESVLARLQAWWKT